MGKMDDKVAEEMFKIYGEFGYQTQDFKHKQSKMKQKADGTMKSIPERWTWTVTTGTGAYKFKVQEELGKMSVNVKGPGGTKKKTKFPYKDYVKREGSELEIVNRDGLVNECKKLFQ